MDHLILLATEPVKGIDIDAAPMVTHVRDGQADPVAIGALLALGMPASALAAEQGLALETVGHLDNTLWTPKDCPLCAADEVLQDLIGQDNDVG